MNLANSVPYESSNTTGGHVIELASDAACDARSRVATGPIYSARTYIT